MALTTKAPRHKNEGLYAFLFPKITLLAFCLHLDSTVNQRGNVGIEQGNDLQQRSGPEGVKVGNPAAEGILAHVVYTLIIQP